MNRSLHNLLRLARKAHNHRSADSLSAPAPYGFSTRVAALWAAERKASTLDLWQRLSWYGAAASVLIFISSAAYRATIPEPNAFDLLLEQPVLEADEF